MGSKIKNVSITMDLNTIQNSTKLIDFVMRIELTQAILVPQLSDFLKNLTIHFSTST